MPFTPLTLPCTGKFDDDVGTLNDVPSVGGVSEGLVREIPCVSRIRLRLFARTASIPP